MGATFDNAPGAQAVGDDDGGTALAHLRVASTQLFKLQF
jgi:hypothetical protein